MKKNYDSHHRMQILKPLQTGDRVWTTDYKTEGKVAGESAYLRSYVVDSDQGGKYRRNRWDLVHLPSVVNRNRIRKETTNSHPSQKAPTAKKRLPEIGKQ